MKVLVACMSSTGNTKKVAEAQGLYIPSLQMQPRGIGEYTNEADRSFDD